MGQCHPGNFLGLPAVASLVLDSRRANLQAEEGAHESTGNTGEQANDSDDFCRGMHFRLAIDHEEDCKRSRENQPNLTRRFPIGFITWLGLIQVSNQISLLRTYSML